MGSGSSMRRWRRYQELKSPSATLEFEASLGNTRSYFKISGSRVKVRLLCDREDQRRWGSEHSAYIISWASHQMKTESTEHHLQGYPCEHICAKTYTHTQNL